LPALVASKGQISAGEMLTAQTRTPLENFKKDISEYNSLVKLGVITWNVYGRAVKAAQKKLESAFEKNTKIKGPGSLGGFPATSDFGELPGAQVSIAGLSIGGTSGINKLVAQGERTINLLTVIAAKEGLS
ncbi:hypothetical protein LCGC14_1676000, partial [marine sediment metagenome]